METFIKSIVSDSAERGFSSLQEYAEEECENNDEDDYAGCILRTRLNKNCIKVFNEATKKNEKEAIKLAEENLKDLWEGTCNYINAGLVKVQLSTAVFLKEENFVKPHYKDVYTFYARTSEGRTRLSDTKDTLKHAKEFAAKYALKHGERIWMKKEKVMD